MNIHEAAKRAVATGGYMVCSRWPFIAVKPTDTSDCCIGYDATRRDKAPGKRWQPQAEDLILDDWRVVRTIDELL